MGLCCYYLRFVKVFAEITSLLYAMTKKGKAFRWFDKCQEAFEKLKDALTEAPVLVMPNEERKFVLEGLTGGHMGRGRTEAQDWGTSEESRIMAQLVDDVQIFAGACSPCAQCYRGPPPRQAHNARWRKVRACINRHHWSISNIIKVKQLFLDGNGSFHKVDRGYPTSQPHRTNSGTYSVEARVQPTRHAALTLEWPRLKIRRRVVH